MSVVLKPRRRSKVIITPFSYEHHGGFDLNVYGQHALGRWHAALGLPLDKPAGDWAPRIPWRATAAECRAWVPALTRGLILLETNDADAPRFEAWRDFVSSCSGYWTFT